MRPTIVRRWSSPSSKTSSAPISMRSRRRAAISGSARSSAIRRPISPRSSARAARMSPTHCGCSICPSRAGGWYQRRDLGRPCARAARGRRSRCCGRRVVEQGLTVRDVERLAQEEAAGGKGDEIAQAARRVRTPTRGDGKAADRRARALRVDSSSRTRAANCASAMRRWSSSTDCAEADGVSGERSKSCLPPASPPACHSLVCAVQLACSTPATFSRSAATKSSSLGSTLVEVNIATSSTSPSPRSNSSISRTG